MRFDLGRNNLALAADAATEHIHHAATAVASETTRTQGFIPRMNTQDQPGSPEPTAPSASPTMTFDDRLRVQFRILARAIGRTPDRWSLYLLVGGITAVIICTAAAQVALNAWNQPFYDAIERRSVDDFLVQLGVFFSIAAILLVLNVSQRGLDMGIRLKLRQMATRDLIDAWMSDKRAARIARLGQIGVNPDQRIHEDTNHLTELTTALGVGLLQALLLLVSFIGVLWELSRGVVLGFGEHTFAIPGYMVWAALLYAATGSWFSWAVGRKLVRLQQTRYAREADLRVALVRGADHADGIALNAAEPGERGLLDRELTSVVAIMRRIVLATVRLTWVTAGYGWVALVFPIVVAAPAYFGGQISFGALMMAVGAFNQVQQSLRWFVDNTDVIADWRATFLRVMTFRQALMELDTLEDGVERFDRAAHPDGQFMLEGLTVMSGQGRSILSEQRLEVGPGEHLVITGKPGAGKSTLFMALAGLWNWGQGRILMPPAEETMFLSQRPHVPNGTLREAMTYALGDVPADDAVLVAALERVGLGHMAGALDRVARWDRELTVQQMQLLALARVVVRRPKWVISDDALDMLENGDRLMAQGIFREDLPDTTVIGISGRPLGDFYTRTIFLTRDPPERRRRPRGPTISREPPPAWKARQEVNQP